MGNTSSTAPVQPFIRLRSQDTELCPLDTPPIGRFVEVAVRLREKLKLDRIETDIERLGALRFNPLHRRFVA